MSSLALVTTCLWSLLGHAASLMEALFKLDGQSLGWMAARTIRWQQTATLGEIHVGKQHSNARSQPRAGILLRMKSPKFISQEKRGRQKNSHPHWRGCFSHWSPLCCSLLPWLLPRRSCHFDHKKIQVGSSRGAHSHPQDLEVR